MRTHRELTYIFTEDKPWLTAGDDTQYKIIEDEDEYIIAFYGSNSKTDWKNNFNFPKKPYKNMPISFFVHRGYLRAWKLINDFFLELVKKVDKPITIVGHSYGAAIATLCMEDLYFNYPDKRNKLRLISFGSPRLIGFFNFRKIKKRWSNSVIYSNPFDLVSHLPPLLFGFKHVKKRCRLNPYKGIAYFRIINNHNINEYRKGLK